MSAPKDTQDMFFVNVDGAADIARRPPNLLTPSSLYLLLLDGYSVVSYGITYGGDILHHNNKEASSSIEVTSGVKKIPLSVHEVGRSISV